MKVQKLALKNECCKRLVQKFTYTVLSKIVAGSPVQKLFNSTVHFLADFVDGKQMETFDDKAILMLF